MKHLYKISILLLLVLLMPTTAFAYDFEVDGIYYNITSANTVEVTYKNLNGSSYGATIVIPSTVTCNSVSYSVTAIGDSAFYCCETKEVTIPETVTAIGEFSFRQCIRLSKVVCQAVEPPTSDNNSFDRNEDYNYIHDPSYMPYILMIVPRESYEKYKDAYGNNDLLIIGYLGAEKTPLPTYSLESIVSGPYDEICGYDFNISGDDVDVFISYLVESSFGTAIEFQRWSRRNSVSIRNNGNCTGRYASICAYALKDGCLPSELIEIRTDRMRTLYDIVDGFDFQCGLCYNYYNGNEVMVTKNCLKWYDYCYGQVINDPVYEEEEYSGYVVIPSEVYGYKVTAIDYYAFNHVPDLTGLEIPATITMGPCIEYAPNLTTIKVFHPIPPEPYYFEHTIYENATLYVPFKSLDAYKNAQGWQNFWNICGISDYDFEVNGYYYKKTNGNEVQLTYGPLPYQNTVIVPSNVTYQGITYSVTGINNDAFYGSGLNYLTIPVTITSIDDSTFTDINLESVFITGNGEWQSGALPETVKTLYIGSGVTGVNGMQVNPKKIYSYATTPPVCDENSFTGYDAELHVPASSVAAYFTAPYWSNFTNIIGDAVAVTNLTLDQDSIEILAGNQASLLATVTPARAVPNDVSWISSDNAVATVDNGMVAAVKAGECDIIATCQDKQAVCHVVVTEIQPTEVTLNQEDAMIEVGGQFTLTATVLPENATNQTVTWTTTNSTVATVDNGVVTAVGPGECNIVATCGNKQVICHVVVVEQFIYISIDEHDTRLLPNHIITLTPTVTPVATDLVVTSSNPEVAAARLAGGKIQVVGIAEGIATIRVNSADGYAFSDSCLVEVYTERGDVNCDGFVNISDATSLIDALLDGSNVYSTENADCNNDGNVTITDLTMLIDALLGGTALPDKDSEIITVNGVSFKMVKVPGGTFTMGGTAGQGDQTYDDEFPLHEVTLSSFSIGETEVTQALWQAVMGSNPSNFTGDLNRPVEMVNWNDCQTFIAKLNQMTGMSFRLPTEAEWEYAARGGKKSHDYMFAGSNDLDEVAWAITNIPSQQPNTPGYGTQPVAQKAPNELGLYDMSGNVYEWCHDWYDAYPAEAQVNPTGPGDDEGCHYHVCRGGGWNRYARSCRVTLRNNVTPESSYFNIGLRLVK